MNRIVAIAWRTMLAAGASLALAPKVLAESNPRASTVHKVFPSAVRVQIAAGGEVVRSASGVAFARKADRTFVLTNAHVVEPGPAWKEPVEVRVLEAGRKSPLRGRVVVSGRVPDFDIAVIEVQGTSIPVTPLAEDDSLELGDDLVVIGAPFGKGLSVAAGIVSQVEYDPSENMAGPRLPRSLKTDAAIGYGSSGGGVFDVPGGRLVGLIEGYRTARVAFGKDEGYSFDVPMPGETFVAPAAKIRRFLAGQGLANLAPNSAGAKSENRAPLPSASRM
ncbi:MAG TPA: serine protease [Anaeromyxobacteraceae bacterium]|nr:serine protease [Anaeromyxobacteraceae bacterium]